MNNVKEFKKVVEEPVPEEKVPVKKMGKPVGVPLFVKIDRYKDLLDIMNDVKSVVFLAKNTLSIQKQIETLVDENRKLIEDAIKKIDERIVMLDNELTKPATFEKIDYERQRKIIEPVDNSLESVVNDLKKQIESLKSDLKDIS